jgi:hypothetical protein
MSVFTSCFSLKEEKDKKLRVFLKKFSLEERKKERLIELRSAEQLIVWTAGVCCE